MLEAYSKALNLLSKLPLNDLESAIGSYATQGSVSVARAVDPILQIKSLAKSVTERMIIYEKSIPKDISIFTLYCHFFASIFALLECFLYILCSGLILLFEYQYLFYYVIYCVSCGKSKADEIIWLRHNKLMLNTHCIMLCGIIRSILIPCENPQLFGFHLAGYHVSRPYVKGIIPICDTTRTLSAEVKPCCDPCCCCCLCCCGTSVAMPIIPMYKLLQLTYFSYGGFVSCNGCTCSPGQYEELLVKAYYQSFQENETTTQEFYQREYHCNSFIELLKNQYSIDINDIEISSDITTPTAPTFTSSGGGRMNQSSQSSQSRFTPYTADNSSPPVAIPIAVVRMDDRYEKVNY